MPNKLCQVVVISTILSCCSTTNTVPIIKDNLASAQTKTIVIQEVPPPVPYVSYYESNYPRYYHHFYNEGYYRHFHYRHW